MTHVEKTVDNTQVDIRERRDDERGVELDIYNEAFPPDWHTTKEEQEAWEAMRRPEDLILRLLAWRDGTAVAAGRCMYSPHHVPGRFEIDVAVRPQSQRQGIGRVLYRRLEEFARAHEARELECGVRVTMLAGLERWLEAEGFREVSRMRESELQLEDLGPELEAEAQERAAKAGIVLTTLAADDSPETRKKLWQLSLVTDRDIPFDTVHADEPYERFEVMLANPLLLPEALVIARHEDGFVGFSILAKQRSDRAFTWSTGVHPDFRGRGVARAMKTYSAAIARRLGFTVMRTFNHTNNPAMLAVNTAMGYKPLPEVVFLVKKMGLESD